ncbi:MAG: hypothetical protein PHD87_08965, partial [Candidatus Cloacimonetes bacterium]|nr:hypothetical protein [Candidatus Cloacimonadota bacterium]
MRDQENRLHPAQILHHPGRPGAALIWGTEPHSPAQSLYLCDFYFNTTIPFLEIVSEQDRLAGERKLVDLLVSKYGTPVSTGRTAGFIRKSSAAYQACQSIGKNRMNPVDRPDKSG